MIGDDPVRGLVSRDNSLLYVANFRSQYVTVYSIDDGKRIRLDPRRRRPLGAGVFRCRPPALRGRFPLRRCGRGRAPPRARSSPCSPPAATPTPSSSRLSRCSEQRTMDGDRGSWSRAYSWTFSGASVQLQRRLCLIIQPITAPAPMPAANVAATALSGCRCTRLLESSISSVAARLPCFVMRRAAPPPSSSTSATAVAAREALRAVSSICTPICSNTDCVMLS